MILLASLAAAPPAAPIAFDDPRVQITAKEHRVDSYLGRDSLLLSGGAVWLDIPPFQDGIVELDLAAPSSNGFHGLAFRAQDKNNFEHVYLRPHLSGQPDAVQYQPIFNGVSGWQIYSDPQFIQPVEIRHDQWIHVRAVIRGKRLQVDVDGTTLVFPNLQRPIAAGKIGILSSGPTACRIANLIVRSGVASEDEGGPGASAAEVPSGAVTRWRISSPFAEKDLDPSKPLDPARWKALAWQTLEPASRGIVNVGMLHSRDKDRDTVFAAVTLHAQTPTALPIHFGFSDRVTVYLNGQPLYRGDDRYQSRDYRFLGTIGLYDQLILPLRRGDNELRFAVSETLGGWGVILQVPELHGVTLTSEPH